MGEDNRMSEQVMKQCVRDWWASYAMTYGDVHGEPVYRNGNGSAETLHFGTREFFDRVDQTFYSWNQPLHNNDGFFGKIFPYKSFKEKKVLEVGCGLGTMAMNWAQHGASVTAIDLNPIAIAQTRERFKLLDLQGNILQVDANNMPFEDDAFDYAYSWGVLHHSPHLERSVCEVFRVLRPGGQFGIMLYNRESLLYRYGIVYNEGILHAESRFLTPLQLASRYTDGAEKEGNPYTWPVTREEMTDLFAPYSSELKMQLFGTDLEGLFNLLLPKLHHYVPRIMKKVWARRWGWSLWINGKKV